MKNYLLLITALIITILATTVKADVIVGTAMIDHHAGEPLDFNEVNPFVGVRGDNLQATAFQNSFGDLAVALEAKVSKELAGLKLSLSGGVAYYQDFTTTVKATGQDYHVEVINYKGIIPVGNVSVSKSFGSLEVGTVVNPVYMGGYIGFTF